MPTPTDTQQAPSQDRAPMRDRYHLASMPPERVQDTHPTIWVFEDQAVHYLSILAQLVHQLDFPRHYPRTPRTPRELSPSVHADTDEFGFLSPEFHAALRRWLFYDVHFAASAGLLRQWFWLHGVLVSVREKNFLSAAANLRGLLEASADLHYSLKDAPSTLVAWVCVLLTATPGPPPRPGSAPVPLFKPGSALVLRRVFHLLKGLNHFKYAMGKLRGTEPSLVHAPAAETTRTYIESFDDLSEPILQLYSLLCEYTHPSGYSFRCFVWPEQDGKHIAPFDPFMMMIRICHEHNDAIEGFLRKSLGSCLLSFKALNLVAPQRLHTPAADAVDLAICPRWQSSWQDIKSMIDGAHEERDMRGPPPASPA